MDKEFQTTFIPKKPLTEEPVQRKASKPLGIFVMIAGLLFFITLIISGGLFFYERMLNQQIEASKASLQRAEDSFQPSLIVELQKLNTRLNVSNTLLSKHIAVSPIFRLLEDLTLKSVQYDQFSYSLDGGKATVTITGVARRYQTIAEQSILFGNSRFVENHIFSNFALNEQGRVNFNLVLTLSPELFYFERSLDEVPDTERMMMEEALEGAGMNTQTESMPETEETETTVAPIEQPVISNTNTQTL